MEIGQRTGIVTLIEKNVVNKTTTILKERIYTELYKLDTDPHYKHIEKKHKNAFVSRELFDYVLAQPKYFLNFDELRQNLLTILGSDISAYIRETVQYCYDRLLLLNYSDLYHPAEETPERFSPTSELYSATWEADATHTFNGTVEVIRFPAITLTRKRELTYSVLKIFDEVAENAPCYIPINLEYLKKHFLDVDYMIIFRQKDEQQKLPIVGITLGQHHYSPEYPAVLCSPAIMSTKTAKAKLGLYMAAMVAVCSPDFGKKELVITGFTQNKRVADLMCMFNPDLTKAFISGYHWPALSAQEKDKINAIIQASGGKPKKENPRNHVLNEAGIDQGRYHLGFRGDPAPVAIKGLALPDTDAVFIMNTVPKNIRELCSAYKNNPHTHYRNRYFGQFLKALQTIETFKRINKE